MKGHRTSPRVVGPVMGCQDRVWGLHGQIGGLAFAQARRRGSPDLLWRQAGHRNCCHQPGGAITVAHQASGLEQPSPGAIKEPDPPGSAWSPNALQPHGAWPPAEKFMPPWGAEASVKALRLLPRGPALSDSTTRLRASTGPFRLDWTLRPGLGSLCQRTYLTWP